MITAYLGELGKKQSMRKESKSRGTLTISVGIDLQASYKSSAKMPRATVPFIIKKFNLSVFTQGLLTYSLLLSSRTFILPLTFKVDNPKPLHREMSAKNSGDLRDPDILLILFQQNSEPLEPCTETKTPTPKR